MDFDGLYQSEEKARKMAREQEDFLKRRWEKDMRYVLRDTRGQRVIWEILSRCGLYQSTYTGKGEDAIYEQARRRVAIDLLNDVINVDKDAFAKMMRANELKHTGVKKLWQAKT